MLEKIGDFKDPLESPISENNRPHNPFVHQDKLYISYYEDGVQVYDVSDGANPTRIAYFDTYPNNNGTGSVSYTHLSWLLARGDLPARDI